MQQPTLKSLIRIPTTGTTLLQSIQRSYDWTLNLVNNFRSSSELVTTQRRVFSIFTNRADQSNGYSLFSFNINPHRPDLPMGSHPDFEFMVRVGAGWGLFPVLLIFDTILLRRTRVTGGFIFARLLASLESKMWENPSLIALEILKVLFQISTCTLIF